MLYKGHYIEEAPPEYRIYKSYDDWLHGESPEHVAGSIVDAKMWIDREPLEEVRPFLCRGCGKILDKVVASFAVLGWDEGTGDYVKVEDRGDLACPYCGAAVFTEKFYLPGEER